MTKNKKKFKFDLFNHDSFNQSVVNLRKTIDEKLAEDKMEAAGSLLADQLAESESEECDEVSFCGHCHSVVKDDQDGIMCDVCDIWYHMGQDCSNLKPGYLRMMSDENVMYACVKCSSAKKSKIKQATKANEIREIYERMAQLESTLIDMIQGIYEQIHDQRNMLTHITQNCQETNQEKDKEEMKIPTSMSYAEKLKKTKNTLVIKSSTDESKAAEKKKEIMKKITTQVDEVKKSTKGHLVINFASKEKLEQAKRELEAEKEKINISVNEKGKLKPKIKISNVPSDDDDLIEGIKSKNPWIGDLIKDEEDFKVVKKLKTTQDHRVHYIIKCTPEIRKQISQNGDVIYTQYARNKVSDSYKIYQCFKCQEFNHHAKDCEKTQVCAKCGDNHKLAECTSTAEKCINCTRKGLENTDHRTNGTRCPIYNEELSRVINKTDHGPA